MITDIKHLESLYGSKFLNLYRRIINDHSGNSYIITHAARLAATVIMLDKTLNSGSSVLELGWSNLLHKYISADITQWDYTKFGDAASIPIVNKTELVVGTNGAVLPANEITIDFEAQNFPESLGKYDFILCCEVIEHMDCDPMHLMLELNRLQATDGNLFITTPNAISARIVYKAVFGYHPSFFIQYSRDRSPYKHNFEYTPQLLESLVLAAGYKLKYWETMDTFEDPFPQGYEILQKLGAPVEHRGDNIFLLASKVGPINDRYPVGIYS